MALPRRSWGLRSLLGRRRGPGIRLPTALALLVLAACGGGGDEDRGPAAAPVPTETGKRPVPKGASQRLARNPGAPKVETIATGLKAPWEIAFLPDGRALVTERPGRVRLLSRALRLHSRPVARIAVAAIGEGGLLGLAVDPKFRDNHFVYLYRTTGGGNQVVRYRFDRRRLRDQRVLVGGIAAGPIHDGGRIHFGPDGRLYFTTGEAGRPDLAQSRRSLNGKVLRMGPRAFRARGGRPEIFSLGHRNPQGLDWQPGTRRLVSDEHGALGNDEVNLLRRGANYGWPEVQGRRHDGFTAPLVVYRDSIAPSGATFVSLPGSAWTGDYLIGALVGEQIRRLSFDGTRVTRNRALFRGDFGRVRTVVEGPDGALYALTSNRDGRGTPRAGDDRVLRIVPPAR